MNGHRVEVVLTHNEVKRRNATLIAGSAEAAGLSLLLEIALDPEHHSCRLVRL
ncbi:MAG: hypothetical protein RMJ75_00165 [Nitrososphaerota archaeon]|nr:hypothetical protein [Nitrososphaerota archaeon]